MLRPKVEIEYTPQDDGTVQIHKIRGFPIGYPKATDPPGFFVHRGTLCQNYEASWKSPIVSMGKELLREDSTYSRKYFDKIRNLCIKDICGGASIKKEKKIRVKKKEIPISVPDTGILVEVKNTSLIRNSYTVTAIKALTYEELPEIYTKNTGKYALPTVWQYDNELLAGKDEITLLEVGESYSYGALKKALCYIELAGRHLAQAKAHYNGEARSSWAKCNTIAFKDGKVQGTTTPTNEFWYVNELNLDRVGLDLDRVGIPRNML